MAVLHPRAYSPRVRSEVTEHFTVTCYLSPVTCYLVYFHFFLCCFF